MSQVTDERIKISGKGVCLPPAPKPEEAPKK